ncbi:MAG TPA: crossover junction endodeoxyribonuclease RuvC [Syntrophomonadaceae bacterium]|nr:crossover junction endodeoxyribonuclease RuvC [Syntrophomonadaceae bacterium]
MLVMGIDPGTATTGYGVVEGQGAKGRLVDYGTIRTPASMPMPDRLLAINRELVGLLDTYHPDVVAIEELFFQRNAKTAISVAQSRGVLVMTAAGAGLQVAEYTPLQVKQAVVGYGNASKRQVQLMVQAILSLKETPQPDDAADALAIAICHLHSYKMNVFYEREK